jgi:hypothetical protein
LTRESVSRGARQRGFLIVTAAVLALAADAASAQGLFDFLFGGGYRQAEPRPRRPPVQAYAPPARSSTNVEDDEPRSGRTGRYTAYCVRLCDGRYFPIQREAGNPADLCKAFCPAARTKIYFGNDIDYATGQDGKRYEKLETAFLYREKVVPDCTCNGKDPFGLVRIEPKDDPTLRPGDIVASNSGLLAYNGGDSRSGNFTPVQSYSGMSKEMRKKLSGLKIMPTAGPKPPQTTSTVGQSSRESRRRRSQGSR